MDWSSSSSGSGGHSSNRLPVFVFPSSIHFYADDNSSLKQILTLYNPYDFTVKFKVLSTAPNKYSVVDPEGSIRSRCYVDIVIRINDISPRNHNKSDEFRIWMYQQAPQSSLFSTSSRLTSSMASSLLSASSSTFSSSGHGTSSAHSLAPLTSGHRDVTATLFATKAQSSKVSNEGDFTMTSSMIASDHRLDQHPIPGGSNRSRRDSSMSSAAQRPGVHGDGHPSLFVIALSVACVTILLMPNADAIVDTNAGANHWYTSIVPYLPLPSSGMKLCAAYVLGVITKLILM